MSTGGAFSFCGLPCCQLSGAGDLTSLEAVSPPHATAQTREKAERTGINRITLIILGPRYCLRKSLPRTARRTPDMTQSGRAAATRRTRKRVTVSVYREADVNERAAARNLPVCQNVF